MCIKRRRGASRGARNRVCNTVFARMRIHLCVPKERTQGAHIACVCFKFVNAKCACKDLCMNVRDKVCLKVGQAD